MLMIVFIPAARIASAGTDLYGVEFNDSELYLVDEATGAATLIGPCEAKNGLSTHESRLFGWDGGREILEIDPTTGATLHSWPVKGDIVGAEGGFAIDRSGVAYFTGRYSYDEFLARIDLNDAGGYTAETVVRDLDILMDGLAFNSSGVLYGLSQGTLDLYTISTSDGSLTRVGNVGVYTEDTAGIAFGDDGTLYALFGKDLYTIDSSTGAATLVGPTGHGARFGGLAALSPLEAVFSLDVGSDMELSDRATADKGEDLDPGDLYRAFGAAGTLHDPPVVDDAALFSKDPPPIQGDPSTALLPGSGFSAAEAFDLDGCDRLRDPLD
ncbi:MAG TPA: hypothetical protein VKA63_10650, partial [Candidatus Krumholzibacteria bacterium]|nr:hypothetical protein [Candidatus Krumholzibacteria bacterium]